MSRILFQNDLASDIEEEFLLTLDEGSSVSYAFEHVFNFFISAAKDHDSEYIVYLTLMSLHLKYGTTAEKERLLRKIRVFFVSFL